MQGTCFQVGISPLYVACWKGHLDIVECLLGANADVNLQRNVRKSYLPYFWGLLTQELTFHPIAEINLMCDCDVSAAVADINLDIADFGCIT